MTDLPSAMPSYLPVIFVASMFFTVVSMVIATYRASSRTVALGTAIVLFALAFIQAGLASMGFYTVLDSVPPRNTFLLLPVLVSTILLLVLPSRAVLRKLPLFILTLVHVVRIPIEIGLWRLHHEGTVPRLMTFEGGNIDIFAGVLAVIMLFIAFKDGKLIPERKNLFLIWNIVGLVLILNIVIRAVFAFPFAATQRWAFDMPNIAMLHFPYVWLAALIAPIVLFSHIVTLWQLTTSKDEQEKLRVH